MININLSFSEFLLNLIKKGIVHFIFAALTYVHDILWKRQLIASFSKEL